MQSTETRLLAALREEKRRSSDYPTALEEKGFKMGEIIGNGSFSFVKKAFDTKRKCYVAVKIISKSTASTTVISKFMPRELNIIRELRHKHVIKFYEYIETTMRFYIVMQFAEKGTLLQLLKQQKRLPECKAWQYFVQLAEAVEYIHNSAIAHRDIKCENIVLDARDCVKLIDFGFSCRVRDAASKLVKPYLSNTFCGSRAYASPELLKGKPYDPLPCDIWASGVVLYIMLFGRLPFSNSKDYRLVLELISKGLPIPTGVNITFELEQLLGQIFVPAKKRLNITQLRKCPWMVGQTSNNNHENDPL